MCNWKSWAYRNEKGMELVRDLAEEENFSSPL